MTISANAVKELRDKTNAGMMDCKKALEQASGNMDQAIEILRKRGLAVAQQKSGRLAHEGILGTYWNSNGKLGCLVEVNCETDFVVKTDDFQNFVAKTTQWIVKQNPKDLNALQASLREELTGLIAKIGENIQVRRFVRWEASSALEKIGFYLHAGSKIGVLVWVSDTNGKMGLPAAKEVAMHIAAMHPRYLRRDEVPAEILEKEKEIRSADKFFSEVCLEDQIFVKDPEGKRTVKDWLKNQSPSAKIEKFARLQVGET